MRSASVGFHCPECVAEGSRGVRRAQAMFGGEVRSRPEVTLTLMGLCGLFFLLTAGGGFLGGSLSPLFQKLALTPSYHAVVADGVLSTANGIAQGQYYRLLTAMFLHFGIVHLALNLWCLWLVGPTLERALGRLRFAALYLLAGLGGSALSYALGPVSQIAAGASGAVFGLFAAFWVMQRRTGQDASQISVIIGLNLVFSFAVPNIDWRGHVGGLVFGALLAAAFVYAPTGPRRNALQTGGALAVAAMVAVMVAVRTAQLTA